uniref:Uncharacterized protein n=1 Tax=Romanomermis culicivorax TaxID=13658 RepID=A0A915J0D1_ROMCU
MLAMLCYPPRIDPNIKFFSPCTMQEMVLINFYGQLGICVKIAVHVPATNASVAIYQYFRDHYVPSYLETYPPVSPDVATLILHWVVGILAQELKCVDAIQTAHFTLFLYKAHGLDNPPCLDQAYNTAISLIDSWMVYPQYMPFPLPPNMADIHCIFLNHHSQTNHPVLMLHRHDFLACWNLLLPQPLPPIELPSDCPTLVSLLTPQSGRPTPILMAAFSIICKPTTTTTNRILAGTAPPS